MSLFIGPRLPFHIALLRERESLGWNPVEISAAMGTSLANYLRWEGGSRIWGRHLDLLYQCFPRLRSANAPEHRRRRRAAKEVNQADHGGLSTPAPAIEQPAITHPTPKEIATATVSQNAASMPTSETLAMLALISMIASFGPTANDAAEIFRAAKLIP